MSQRDKTQAINGTHYRYSTEWIYSLESEEHWRCYWMQQRTMEGLLASGQHVLEIGVGSGFTANYLRSKGVIVTTVDIDAEKRPDIVANIVAYEFLEQYDHVLAYEVFEHIPFPEFKRVSRNIAGICRGYLFLSVPRSERVWFRCEVFAPKLGHRTFEITTPRTEIVTAHHFWEVDDGNVSRAEFDEALINAGYRLERKKKAFSRLFYALAAPALTECAP